MKKTVTILSFLLLTACAARQVPAPITSSNDVVKNQPKVLDYSKPAGAELLNQKRFYFGFNSTKVELDNVPVLKAHADYLKQHPNMRVILMGYSDPVGNSHYNKVLAKRRAQSIANQLMVDGVTKDRIRIVAYGMTEKMGNTHANDRRVDLIYGGK